MLIEFAGVSGVGKTTIIETIYKHLMKDNDKIVVPQKIIVKPNGFIKRNIRKSVYAVLDIFERPADLKTCIKLLSYATDIRGYQRIKLLINFTSYNYVRRKYSNPSKIYLIDEGVYQLIWSYYLRTKYSPRIETIQLFFKLFDSPNYLILIDASSETIAARLNKRNSNEYIQRTNDLEKRIDEMRKKMIIIIEMSTKTHYMESEKILFFDNTSEPCSNSIKSLIRRIPELSKKV